MSTQPQVFEIPLQAAPQKLSITLAGVAYNLNVYWNNISKAWIFDLLDANNNSILTGIPIVTGCDLLAQFEYLNAGGALVAQSDHDPTEVPGFTTLGATGHLYFISSE